MVKDQCKERHSFMQDSKKRKMVFHAQMDNICENFSRRTDNFALRFIVHPKDPDFMRVDRDFVFMLNAFDIDPGTYVPKIMTMTDFNLWCWNSRLFPDIDPLVINKGDRVRVRAGNLTMTNHPIHIHGYDFEVTCTDGGWVPKEARWQVRSSMPPKRSVSFHSLRSWLSRGP